jgi:sortase A
MTNKLLRLLIGVIIITFFLYPNMLPNLNLHISNNTKTVLNISIGSESTKESIKSEDVVDVVITPTPIPTEITPFIPARIEMNEIKLDAQIVPVKIEYNTLNAPTDFFKVGWQESSGLAGSKDTVIMDGHYDNKSGEAVFFNLKYLKLNQKINVYSSSDNKCIKYRVVCIESYDRLNAPNEKIFKNDGRYRLNLITCYGTFDKKLGTYNKRLVVYCLIDGGV